MPTVWITRCWMPPSKFLTFCGVYASEKAAIKGAWSDTLEMMHQDRFVPVIHPASDYFTGHRKGNKVVAPTKRDTNPRALVVISEEEIIE